MSILYTKNDHTAETGHRDFVILEIADDGVSLRCRACGELIWDPRPADRREG